MLLDGEHLVGFASRHVVDGAPCALLGIADGAPHLVGFGDGRRRATGRSHAGLDRLAKLEVPHHGRKDGLNLARRRPDLVRQVLNRCVAIAGGHRLDGVPDLGLRRSPAKGAAAEVGHHRTSGGRRRWGRRWRTLWRHHHVVRLQRRGSGGHFLDDVVGLNGDGVQIVDDVDVELGERLLLRTQDAPQLETAGVIGHGANVVRQASHPLRAGGWGGGWRTPDLLGCLADEELARRAVGALVGDGLRNVSGLLPRRNQNGLRRSGNLWCGRSSTKHVADGAGALNASREATAKGATHEGVDGRVFTFGVAHASATDGTGRSTRGNLGEPATLRAGGCHAGGDGAGEGADAR